MKPYFLLVASLLLSTSLTPRLRANDLASIVAEGAQLQLKVSDCKFTEGPAADKEGNVYFTDQPNDRIIRVSVDGEVADFMMPAGRSNGMFFSPDGKLIACADDKNEMWEIDTQTGSHTTIFSTHEGSKLNGPNDVWVHPSGVMFFTDPFYKRPWWKHNDAPQNIQALYRVSKNRQIIERQEEGFKQPNGIVGDAKRALLFVADIGDQKTYAYPIRPDATLGKRKLFCEEGSDGMTLDDAGNLYLTGRAGVTVFASDGERLGVIAVPEAWTANVCFGGKEHRTLFITASDSLYTLETKTRGL